MVYKSYKNVFEAQFHISIILLSVAPLDENEYSPGEEQADSLSSQSNKTGKFRSFENGSNEFPSLLNVPLGSDGQGSHDSHNDSGYSTRFGYSAGPSPSLSGKISFGYRNFSVGFRISNPEVLIFS